MFALICSFLSWTIFAFAAIGYLLVWAIFAFAALSSLFVCTIFAFCIIWPLFDRGREPLRSPPPATITGVRIPVDGTPPHLLSLTTINLPGTSRSPDRFLVHAPDLRRYWKTEHAWDSRNLYRLDLRDQRDLPRDDRYYVFYSFALDDLPENASVPDWICGGSDSRPHYRGDVFVVKMAPHENGPFGWAVYEDVAPEFLDFVVRGPSYGWRRRYYVAEKVGRAT